MNALVAEMLGTLAAAAILGVVCGWMIKAAAINRKQAQATDDFNKKCAALAARTRQDIEHLEDSIQQMGDNVRTPTNSNRTQNKSLRKKNINRSRSKTIALNQQQGVITERFEEQGVLMHSSAGAVLGNASAPAGAPAAMALKASSISTSGTANYNDVISRATPLLPKTSPQNKHNKRPSTSYQKLNKPSRLKQRRTSTNPLFIRLAILLPITLTLAYFLRIVGTKFRGTDSFDYFMFYNQIDGWDGLFNANYLGDHLFSILTYTVWLTGVDGYTYLWLTFALIVFAFLYGPSQFFSKTEPELFYASVLLLLCSSSIYLLSLNGIRQGAAGAVAAMGVYHYINNRGSILRPSNMLFFVAAFFFHKSSLLFPVAIFGFEMIRYRISTGWLLAAALGTGLLFKGLVVLVVDTVQLPGISDEFEWYDRSKTGSTSIFLKVGFMVVFALVFDALSNQYRDGRHRMLVKLYAFLAAAQLLFIGYEMIINRLLLYTSMLEPIIIVSQARVFKKPGVYLAVALALGVAYLAVISLWHPSFRDELGLL